MTTTQRKANTVQKFAPYWKAVVGFVAPGAVLMGSAVFDTSQAGSKITTAEWVTALVACVVTAAAVERTPNKDPQALHQAESVQPPDDYQGQHEAGAVDVLTVVLMLCILIATVVTLLLFRVRF